MCYFIKRIVFEMKDQSNFNLLDPKNDEKWLKLAFWNILESLCRYSNMQISELWTTTYDFWRKKDEIGRF